MQSFIGLITLAQSNKVLKPVLNFEHVSSSTEVNTAYVRKCVAGVWSECSGGCRIETLMQNRHSNWATECFLYEMFCCLYEGCYINLRYGSDLALLKSMAKLSFTSTVQDQILHRFIFSMVPVAIYMIQYVPEGNSVRSFLFHHSFVCRLLE